jgi:hypothetical protein
MAGFMDVMDVVTLQSFVGKTVAAVIPLMHKTKFQEITIRGVEHGGIWIESQALTNAMIKAAGLQDPSKTPVFFLPFSQIVLLMTSVEGMSVSEGAFGIYAQRFPYPRTTRLLISQAAFQPHPCR